MNISNSICTLTNKWRKIYFSFYNYKFIILIHPQPSESIKDKTKKKDFPKLNNLNKSSTWTGHVIKRLPPLTQQVWYTNKQLFHLTNKPVWVWEWTRLSSDIMTVVSQEPQTVERSQNVLLLHCRGLRWSKREYTFQTCHSYT